MKATSHKPTTNDFNMNASWKQERSRLVKFYNETPFYGSEQASRMYDLLKKKFNVIQTSHCGVLVSVVTYKGESDKMVEVLHKMFGATPKQIECPYTGFVTTFVKYQ